MNRKTIVSLLAFAVAVLVFTRLDYLTNAELYKFGLQFSDAWYLNYTILYNALFQLVIGLTIVYSRNWRLAVIQEAFVLSCAQDLVYFGLWSGGVFPTGNWTWMSMYQMIGTWTTPMQIGFSLAITMMPIVAFQIFKHQITQLQLQMNQRVSSIQLRFGQGSLKLRLNTQVKSLSKPRIQTPTLINKQLTPQK